MLIVASVDIFAFYRADVRAQIEAGRAFVFDIDGTFLLGAVLYVAVPTLMIAASTLLPRRVIRVTNVVVATIFAVTIVGAAVGEWTYYLVASTIELLLLTGVIFIAMRWRDVATIAARSAEGAVA